MSEPQLLHVLLATLSGCNPAQLDDADAIEDLLRDAAMRAGFSLLDTRTCPFEPQGVTGVAIVGESHLAIHTWPETRTLFFEVVSCAGRQMTLDALAVVTEALPGATVGPVQELTHSLQ